MFPPIGCHDERLWFQANDLAQGHVPDRGFCMACGTAAPCRVLDAAQDAMRRAMAPPPADLSPADLSRADLPPADLPPADLPPMAPPRRSAAVGARFPRVRDDDQPAPAVAPETGVESPVAEPPLAEHPVVEPPVGARFRHEPRIGRRRRAD